MTAGSQSSMVKNNLQLPQDSVAARQLGEHVLDALANSGMFVSAALPQRIFPPLFNRYGVGHSFGLHVDNAIRGIPGTPIRICTDLSCTLFLSEADEYEGGELMTTCPVVRVYVSAGVSIRDRRSARRGSSGGRLGPTGAMMMGR